MEVALKRNERIDDLHRNGLKLIQNPDFFCFGIDAVLLSGFVKVNKDDVVLDLCSGNGIIPILLTDKSYASTIYSLEIQEELSEQANRSVRLNNLQDKVKIINGDVKILGDYFKPSSIDVITVNPPYMNDNGGIINKYDKKAIARHEILCSLEDIIINSSKTLKVYGKFYMVHRPSRLVDIMYLLRQHKLEPKTIRFVEPYKGKEPNMVLIEAIRQAKPLLKVMGTLTIYNDDGTLSTEANKIYYE